MKRAELLRKLHELYSDIILQNKVSLYFVYESEIDRYYESLDAQADLPYDPEELELLRRIFDLHQKLIRLMENKQLQSGMMKRISGSSYTSPQAGESYFFDKKS